MALIEENLIYFTAKEFADKNNLAESTIRKKASDGILKNIQVNTVKPTLYAFPEEIDTSVVAFMNLKGGAGKTTISVHTAIWLADLGFKVLLIDTDHQNQCRFFFEEFRYSYNIGDVLSGEKNIKDAIYPIKSQSAKLDMIFSSYDVAFKIRELKETTILTEKIEEIKNEYDFIIIDTSPDLNIMHDNVAIASTHIFIPAIPNRMNYEGVEHELRGLKVAMNQDLTYKVKGIIFNMFNHKREEHNYFINIAKEDYPTLYIDQQINYDTYLEKVASMGTNIFEERPKANASVYLKNVIWEILRRI